MPIPLKNLQQMALYLGVVSGGGCALMYYFMQKTFASKEYYLSAVEKLKSQTEALEVLGAPPLKVHYLRLTDKHNRVSPTNAQIKIPVSGTISAGYLYTTSIKENLNSRWSLQEVILQLNNGQRIPIYHLDYAQVKGETLENELSNYSV
ncbi:cytochrome c oxidase assembly factor 1 homolog [Spea bombifrons]|uniref:cytochrome c oxidase assembly factor 1 homolog n=1 Tax=Spea bombifrons TaxID=233779 RepID=UPI002349EAEB|nr:cytochrome c oxidase assembly factor 1 homolog [Spea bombifrons]